MSNQVTSLSFDTSSNIRIKFINNEPYFCLVDICNILDLTDPSKTAKQIKEEFGCPELNSGHIIDSLNRQQLATFISKKQLYFVMMRSRSSVARAFRQWICKVF